MNDFIKINDSRIRKNTIKKYLPYMSKQLNIYFNTSRQKIELETFKFPSESDRDDMVMELDLAFGISAF